MLILILVLYCDVVQSFLLDYNLNLYILLLGGWWPGLLGFLDSGHHVGVRLLPVSLLNIQVWLNILKQRTISLLSNCF
jgi:hypothetical protein